MMQNIKTFSSSSKDLRVEVEIWPFRACANSAMHPAIIIRTVCSLWTSLWGRCHIPQNVFLVCNKFNGDMISLYRTLYGQLYKLIKRCSNSQLVKTSYNNLPFALVFTYTAHIPECSGLSEKDCFMKPSHTASLPLSTTTYLEFKHVQ